MTKLYLEVSRSGWLMDIKWQNNGVYEDKGDVRNLIWTTNCKGLQGGSVLTPRTEEAVWRAGPWEAPPAGHGLKGKGLSCLCLWGFRSKSAPASNWHWFPASATFSAWEPGQKLWIWARFHCVVGNSAGEMMWTPWQVVKHPSFSGFLKD